MHRVTGACVGVLVLGLGLPASTASAAVLTKINLGGGAGGGYMVMPVVGAADAGDGIHLQVQINLDYSMVTAPLPYTVTLTPNKPGDSFNNAVTPTSWEFLNNKAYNREWGWSGSYVLPYQPGSTTNREVWQITRISQSPGLDCYQWTSFTGAVNKIFANDGDTWLYSGSGMAHNVYAIDPAVRNDVSATYSVAVWNPTGGPSGTGALDDTFLPGEITLHWASVPEPATIGLLTVGMLLTAARRKRPAGSPRR